MKTRLLQVLRGAGLLLAGYLIVLLVITGVTYLRSKSVLVSGLYDQVIKPTVGFSFSADSQFVYVQMQNEGVAIPIDPRFSQSAVETYDDYDHVVFLLDDFAEAPEHKALETFGLNGADYADAPPDAYFMKKRFSMGVRLDPLPIYSHTRKFTIVDLTHILETYRAECHERIIQDLGAGIAPRVSGADCIAIPGS